MGTAETLRSEPDADIPAGFVRHTSPSPFVNVIGPLYRKPEVAEDATIRVVFGLKVERQHLNGWESCHGAMLAAVVDIVTAAVAYPALDRRTTVTVELNTYFIQAPKLGDWIDIEGRLVRRTRSLAFVRIEGLVAGEAVFTGSSLSKCVGP